MQTPLGQTTTLAGCGPRAAVLILLAIAAPLTASASGTDKAREAAAELQNGRAEKAIELLNQAIADTALANDRRAALHNDRGVALSRLARYREAIDDFNRAATLVPENATTYNNRGNVLLALGLPDEAVRDFDRALLLAPSYAAALANRAAAYAGKSQTAAAITDYSRAIRLAPGQPAALNGRGRLHLDANRPHAALRDFNRAVTVDARFGPGYRGRAGAKIALGRFDEAIEDLSRAVAFDPTNVELYVTRGHAYLAVRSVPSALKDFKRANELDPRSHAAIEGHALALLRNDETDEALSELAKAIEIEPRSAQAYAYRAVVYKTLGQVDLARRDLDRAIRLEPKRPEVVWARGEIAEASSDATDEVIAELRQALAARPLLRELAATLERLGSAEAAETEVLELSFERWRVTERQGRYFATTPDLPRLQVPLETMSETLPRILAFDAAPGGQQSFAVLRFLAGQTEGPNGPIDIEHGAVIDMVGRTVPLVEVVRDGERELKWEWTPSRLIITGIDGVKTEHELMPAKPQVSKQQPQQRRSASTERRQRSPDGTPSWAPWAQGGWGGGGGGGSDRRQPRTLFDLLFKGN